MALLNYLAIVCYSWISVSAAFRRVASFERNSGPVRAVEDISEDPYVFTTIDLPEEPRYFPTIANGHLATVPVVGNTVYLNGLYNGERGESHRAKVPSLHNVRLDVIGDLASVSHTLDTYRGHFRQEHDFGAFTITHYQFAHQVFTRLLVNVLEIRSTIDSPQEVQLRITTIDGPESADLDFEGSHPWKEALHDSNKVPPEGTIDCYRTKVLEDGRYQQQLSRVCVASVNADFPSGDPISVQLEGRGATHLGQYSLYDSSPEEIAQTQAMVSDKSALEILQGHEASWIRRMNSMTIDVEGDLQLAKVIHGSIYYILSSLPSHEDPLGKPFYGLSPGSLAYGDLLMDYQGHSFWDTETWMYPAYVLFDPAAAKATLDYRIRSMTAARDRAANTGYDGARFPWESGFTGAEVTPDCCPETSENQQHITADIAFAARQYLALTDDVAWLLQSHTTTGGGNETGCSFLVDGIGKFWLSRVDGLNPETRTYDILGVMPPDEDHAFVNNSVYTNVAAGLALYTAKYASCLCDMDEAEHPYLALLEPTARSISLPFDAQNNFHPEFDGYSMGETIKQADVVLLGFPLGYQMDASVRRRDLELYEEAVRPTGPAMTWSMHAVGWAELGSWHRAEVMFNKSYQPYFREPFKVWTEAQDGLGAMNFITGMGGFLQAVLYGYGGIRVKLDSLEFDLNLPPGTTALSIQGLQYKGNVFNVKRDPWGTTFTPTKLSGDPLYLLDYDAVYIVDSYKDIQLGPVPFWLFGDPTSSCPIPEDIIGQPVEKFVKLNAQQQR